MMYRYDSNKIEYIVREWMEGWNDCVCCPLYLDCPIHNEGGPGEEVCESFIRHWLKSEKD